MDSVKPVIILQRDTNANWNYYTPEIIIKSDVLKIDGTRFMTISFVTSPASIGYYPRQNDIILDATNLVNGNTITVRYSRPASNEIGMMFLSEFSDTDFTFKPLLNLDENVFFQAGKYLPQDMLGIAIGYVWPCLVGNSNYFLSGGGISIISDISATITYEQNTQVKISDIFKMVIAQLAGGWDLYFTYKLGYDAPRITINGSAFQTRKLSNYVIDMNNINIQEISTMSRNKNTGISIVIGYLPDGSRYKNFAYLDENLIVQTAELPTDGVPILGNTPRVSYVNLESADINLLKQSATKELQSSVFVNDAQLVFKIRLDEEIAYASVGQAVNLIGVQNSDIKIAPIREVNFATNEIIIGDNDDITF